MRKPAKPRPDIWKGAPYGRYEGTHGSPEQWGDAFRETWDKATAQKIIGDNPETPWTILSIPQGSPWEVVRQAYRVLIRRWHPDLCKEEGAEEQCKRVVAAYSILEDYYGKGAK